MYVFSLYMCVFPFPVVLIFSFSLCVVCVDLKKLKSDGAVAVYKHIYVQCVGRANGNRYRSAQILVVMEEI